jgi:CMP/dCMP kinase
MQNVVISGRSYSGTTTIARSLSETLNWQFISAGERFRSYCCEHGCQVTYIPFFLQLEFDSKIKSEITNQPATIFEGRYLGYFCKDLDNTLRVLIKANISMRIERCLKRESIVKSASDASEFIMHRDNREDSDAKELYGLDNFLDESFFDLQLDNDDLLQLEENIRAIAKRIGG